MPKKNMDNDTLQTVRVEVPRRKSEDVVEDYSKRVKRKSKSSTRSSEFVYQNNAYVGSLNSVNEARIPEEPIAGVIREQYWACSKWPFAQRVLAIAVGVLLGAVIGLAVTLVLRAATNDGDIGDIFTRSAPD